MSSAKMGCIEIEKNDTMARVKHYVAMLGIRFGELRYVIKDGNIVHTVEERREHVRQD